MYFCGLLDVDVDEESNDADVDLDLVETSDHVPSLVQTPINTQVQFIACGPRHCMAITQEGAVYSWGSGEFGKLGLGQENDTNQPTRVCL